MAVSYTHLDVYKRQRWVRLLDKMAHQADAAVGREETWGRYTIILPSFWLDMGILDFTWRTLESPSHKSVCTAWKLWTISAIPSSSATGGSNTGVCCKRVLGRSPRQQCQSNASWGRYLELCDILHRRDSSGKEDILGQHNKEKE